MSSGFLATLDLLAKQSEFMASPGEMRLLPTFSMVILHLDRSPEGVRELFRRLKEEVDPSPVYVHVLYQYLNLEADKDPVPPESQGKAKEVTAAWLAWGARNGYI